MLDEQARMGPATEQDRVELWRIEFLERLGFDGPTACALAMDRTVDIHRAEDLKRAGCPLETIRRIL